MLQINRISIKNFACFENIVIEPSTSAEKPLTVIRAENGSGKTTLLRAIRWGMYGESGLPGNTKKFSLHPAFWDPDDIGIQTSVSILFENDGSSRNQEHGRRRIQQYELRRTVTTCAKVPTSPNDLDFARRQEDAELLIRSVNGSWIPHTNGAAQVIEELLPINLRDFFVMDADEAADFVGGGENKPIDHKDVIKKTSFAMRSLLGLEVFEASMNRLEKISREFGRNAAKSSSNGKLDSLQGELDSARSSHSEIEQRLKETRVKKHDCSERLSRDRELLEEIVGRVATHEETRTRFRENESRRKKVTKDLMEATTNLSGELCSLDLLVTLATREISTVKRQLQPMYEDGRIPLRHLPYVRGLLNKGVCVCGGDLSSEGERRRNVVAVVSHSRDQADKADYLERVFHAAKFMHRSSNEESWDARCQLREKNLAEVEIELDDLLQAKREIEEKLDSINDEELGTVRMSIKNLEEQLSTRERSIVSDEQKLQGLSAEIHKLEASIRVEKRKQTRGQEYVRYEEVTRVMTQILRKAYSCILSDQVRELESKMNSLFLNMAANVVDDEVAEDVSEKATIRMISKVGIRPVDENTGTFEIYAMNRRNKSMPPTEINGASRRILALSFVLGLCEVSRTRAPLIADSLLNFMSGLVRTNTLRVTSQTARQPILLLTGSDLESESEINLVSKFAGRTYTLTGQWQHKSQGGDVVHLNDERQVSLLCQCGPQEYCVICEREGQAKNRALKFIDRGKLK